MIQDAAYLFNDGQVAYVIRNYQDILGGYLTIALLFM